MSMLDRIKDWNTKAGKLYDTYIPVLEKECGTFAKGLNEVNKKYQKEKAGSPKDKPKPIEVKVVNPCTNGSRKDVRSEPNEYAGRGVSDKLFKSFRIRRW